MKFPLVAAACAALLVPSTAAAAAPKVPKKPAGAAPIVRAELTWHVRESFVRYLAAGEGARATGATKPGAAVTTPETDVPLVYDFSFARRAGGWRDPDTGRARVLGRGGVLFSYAGHGIRLTASDPEVELRGASSRVVFKVRDGAGKAVRTVLFKLDLAKAVSSSVSADGRTFRYEQVPGVVPGGTAATVFNGFYQPGEPFGWVTVSLTTR